MLNVYFLVCRRWRSVDDSFRNNALGSCENHTQQQVFGAFQAVECRGYLSVLRQHNKGINRFTQFRSPFFRSHGGSHSHFS